MKETNKTDMEITRAWYIRQNVLGAALKSVLDETDYRVDLIVEMIQDHGFTVISEARAYVEDGYTDKWDFEAFVYGTKVAVIKRLHGRISDAMTLALSGIIPDVSRYGCVKSYGNCDQNVAELFMDMCVDGVVEERIGELISYDVELYSGKQDEPEDDVDLDKLLIGMMEMMERHGVTGDVKAKAKTFLAAGAEDALHEVLAEE